MLPICILAIEDASDREFMTDLYIQYNRLMYKTIKGLVHNESDIEDILQSTLERLIDKIPTLRGLSVPQRANYVVSACRRISFNYNRTQSRHPVVSLDESFEAVSEVNVADQVIHQLDLESLMRIWDKMDEQTRFLLSAKYLMEASDAEIAAQLGISTGSVRTYLTRARRRAYELMEQEH